MKKISYYIALLLIVICVFTPLYRESTSDLAIAEESAKYVKEKWENDVWGILTDGVETFKEKLFQEDDPAPRTSWDRTKTFLTYGFGYGVNTLGGLERVIQNARFNFYPRTGMTASFLLLILFIEFFVMMVSKWRHLIAFMGLLGVLGALLLYGSTLEPINKTEGVLWGWIIFIGIQLSLMTFYSKKKTKQNQLEKTPGL